MQCFVSTLKRQNPNGKTHCFPDHHSHPHQSNSGTNMIVIRQPALQTPLPQPAGPSKSSAKGDGSSALAAALPGSGNGGVTLNNTSNVGGHVLRKRTMHRTTSMFQPKLGEPSSSSSRSSSPLTSLVSSRTSPGPGGQSLLSTPASTAPSSSIKGAKMTGAKAVGQVRNAASKATSKSAVGTASLSEDPAAISYDVPTDIALPTFARQSASTQRDLARVWEAVAGARRIVVISGAGVSVSSPANIPDFRSAQGLFRKLKEKHPNAGLQSGKDLFDANVFKSPSNSSLFYSMVSELKAMADAAAPTTFHHLLKRLDLEGRLMRVYTQNIDGLEEKAGLTFGLGETGNSRATLRALGKRKREMMASGMSAHRQGGFARSKSDSAVLFASRSSAMDDLDDEAPMFPRVIPLHGTLSTMTCQVCSHKVYLSLASPGPQCLPQGARELSPDASDDAVAAMDLLSHGEPVACKRCLSHEEVRSVAGLRSRGVGMMKVDVVLYNGQNEGAERVGDCVERDILGLRDPNEASVPETYRERMARERRERKANEPRKDGSASQQSTSAQSPVLQPIIENSKAEDVFGSNFFDETDEQKDEKMAEALVLGPESVRLPSSQPILKPKRQARLKPLPPDLLIVAGTSLKVPGTKRVVREFAKACQARDFREYPSSDESEDEDSKGRSRSSTPRQTHAKASKAGEEAAGEQDEEEEEEEDDINAPIRTILLNYDFPAGQWEDVFDVWIQGNVQQSALGLWEASTFPADGCANNFSMREDDDHQLPKPELSWSMLQDTLDAERKAAKKSAAAAARKTAAKASNTDESALSQSSQKSSQASGSSQKAKNSKSATATKSAAPATHKASAATEKATAAGKKKQVAAHVVKTKATASTPPMASPNKKKARSAKQTVDPNSDFPPASPLKGGLEKYMKGSKAVAGRLPKGKANAK